MSDAKRPFLYHIHYFRAFAIINIIIVHIWRIPPRLSEIGLTPLVNSIRENIFHGSTIYFLFISGFLFYYLSSNFSIRKYFRNKFCYVAAPYLLITLFFALKSEVPRLLARNCTLFDSFKVLILNVFLGKAQIQYWYIPFIMTVFLISPLLLKIPPKVFKYLAILSFLLPMLGTRTSTELTIGQYVYFLPVYIQGMFTAMHYETISTFLKKARIPLIILFALSLAIEYWSDDSGQWRLHISSQYVNRISFTYLVLHFLREREQYRSPLISAFADYSFALYFTHLIGESSLSNAYYSLFLEIPFFSEKLPFFLLSIIYVALRIFATLGLCILIKKLLGQRSRYIIGA